MCHVNELGRALAMVEPAVMPTTIFTISPSNIAIKRYLCLDLQEGWLWQKGPVRLDLVPWVALPQTTCVILSSSSFDCTSRKRDKLVSCYIAML